MAVIKPVQFPQVQRPPVQNTPRSVRVRKIAPPIRETAAQTGKVRPRINAQAKFTSGVESTKEEKLEVAIEVLRQKTAQFYGPQKKDVKQTSALGTFIDIKA